MIAQRDVFDGGYGMGGDSGNAITRGKKISNEKRMSKGNKRSLENRNKTLIISFRKSFRENLIFVSDAGKYE